MKFGKDFTTHLEETLPEWRDRFLCYKPLKKLLKSFPLTPDQCSSSVFNDRAAVSCRQSREIGHEGCNVNGSPRHPPSAVSQDLFMTILNQELEKLNDFFIDKEEGFVIRLQSLEVRIEGLKEKRGKNDTFGSQSGFSEEMMNIRKDLVSIHGEMILLKNYSALNFAALLKILKKYDKRTGGLLRLPFTQIVVHQPFFATEPLTRLVHECELHLEVLFPLEPEVDESVDSGKTPSVPQQSKVTRASDESLSLGEPSVDIYRGTLAALRAIKGLQKTSSTYNPLSLSLSSIFQIHNDESASGDVTTDGSASNSPALIRQGGTGDLS